MSAHISKNIFWLTASRVAALVLLFFAYTQLFRYLGPFGSGQYQFILSYVLLFSTVVDFGIQQFITKKISENPERTNQYFRDFFSFEIAVSFLLYAVLLLVAALRHYERSVLCGIGIAGLGMVANALTYPYLAVMAAKQDLRKVAWINFINSLINVAIIFLAVTLHRSIVFLASVQLVFGLTDLALYRLFAKKYLAGAPVPQVSARPNIRLVADMLAQGWPFALLVGFSAIYNRIDVVIITALKGYQQTGYYTAAYKIFDLLGFFPSVVSYTLFPFFASLMAKNAVAEVRNNIEKYVRLMFAAALPMAVGGTLLSAKLINLVAGPGYAPGAAVLSVLIWAPAVLFVYIPVNSLVISQLTKKAVIVTGANVIVNIAGNLLLIPRFGIQAAAVMTVVSECLQGAFYFYFVYTRITKFSVRSFILPPVVSSFVMGLLLWRIRSGNVALSLIFGFLTYVLALVITGFLKKEDAVFALSLFQKQSRSENP